jgi:hypothetical protein
MGRSGATSLWSSGKTFYLFDVFGQEDQFIELISFIFTTTARGCMQRILNASTWHNFLDYTA